MINSRWWWSSRFSKFKMAVVRARVVASPKFKMARVDAPVEFKMAVIIFACTDASARWLPCARCWRCFDGARIR